MSIAIPLTLDHSGHTFFEQLFSDNFYGMAVYSADDYTLLRANDRYLSIVKDPNLEAESIIGLKADEIFSDWQISKKHDLFDRVVSQKKSFYSEEREYTHHPRQSSFWNINAIPILENDSVKYVVVQLLDVTEKVNARRLIEAQTLEIEKHNAKMNAIFAGSAGLLLVIGKEGKFERINQKVLDTFRCDHIDNIEHLYDLAEFYDIQGNRVNLENMAASLIINGSSKDGYCKCMIKKTGQVLYLNLAATPIYDSEGNFLCGIIVANDITEQVIQTQTIEQQRTELELILDNIPVGVSLIDKNGEYKFVNKLIKRSLARLNIDSSLNPVGEVKCFDKHGNELDNLYMPSLRILKGETINQEIIEIKQGSNSNYYSITGVPVYDKDGLFDKGIFAAVDVTQSINDKKVIETQKKQIEAVIENIAEELFIIDREGNYTLLNSAAKKQFSEVELQKMYDVLKVSLVKDINGNILSKEDLPITKLRNGNTVSNEIIYIEYQNRYLNVNCVPIFDEENNLNLGVITSLDVSDSVQRTKELERIMRMQEEFFSFIAHEFRTPLTTISATLQLLDLVYSKDMSPNLRRYISTIKRSTFQQLRLVNNLLDITRAESGYLRINKKNYDIVSTTRLILESIKPFAQAKDIKLKFVSALSEKPIALDDEKYERILLNLLSNAIKFTPKGKSITVSLSASNGKVYVCIKDQGIGIPEDKQSLIFEKFGQTNNKRSRDNEGTGIGLCLVKLLVESLDGRISVTSKENKGSTFIIELPETPAESVEALELPELMDNRLIQRMEIEFSSIYLENM